MSKVSTGAKKEKLCADELKADGWIIWKTVRHRFLNIDLFGAYDVVAYKPGRLRFIQVTTTSAHGKRPFLQKFIFPPYCTNELWIYKKLKKFTGFHKELINQLVIPEEPGEKLTLIGHSSSEDQVSPEV